jgi:hypothetical protein
VALFLLRLRKDTTGGVLFPGSTGHPIRGKAANYRLAACAPEIIQTPRLQRYYLECADMSALWNFVIRPHASKESGDASPHSQKSPTGFFHLAVNATFP